MEINISLEDLINIHTKVIGLKKKPDRFKTLISKMVG